MTIHGCDYCGGEYDVETNTTAHQPYCVYFDELFADDDSSQFLEAVKKRYEDILSNPVKRTTY